MTRVLPINFFDAGEDPLTDLASDIQLEREAHDAHLLRELEREAGELSEEGLLQALQREANELSDEGLLRALQEERRRATRQAARNPLRALWDAVTSGRSFELDPRAGRDVRSSRRIGR